MLLNGDVLTMTGTEQAFNALPFLAAPAKSRTRERVALSSAQRAVIWESAARLSSARSPGGVRIQLATFLAGGGAGTAVSRRSRPVSRRRVRRLPR